MILNAGRDSGSSTTPIWRLSRASSSDPTPRCCGVISRSSETSCRSRSSSASNERFGTDFTGGDQVFIRELEDRLAVDQALVLSVRANTPENARLTFDHVVSDRLQDMVDTNFKFYKRVTDDQQFAKAFLDWLFERFRKNAASP